MRKLNKNQKQISSFVTILLLTIFSLTGQNSIAQARDTGSFVNGGKFIFAEKKDHYPSSGLFTYFFINNTFGMKHDDSHDNWHINKACLDSFNFIDGGHFTKTSTSIVLSSDKAKWEFGKDGSYKAYTMYVIKHNHGTAKNTIDSVYFTLDENVQLKEGWVFHKAATPFDSAKLTTIDYDCPLPVTWYKVYVEVGDGNNKIHFSTATENNNWKFKVERSNGDGHFLEIGEVLSKAISGNSSMILRYDFNDMNPLPNNNYYRVKQIDRNGDSSYSPIFSAKFNPDPGLEVYPNPSKTGENITVNVFGFEGSSDHVVFIHDNLGKIIREYHFSGTGNIISVFNLDPGMYQILASGVDSMGRNKIFRQRLIVK